MYQTSEFRATIITIGKIFANLCFFRNYLKIVHVFDNSTKISNLASNLSYSSLLKFKLKVTVKLIVIDGITICHTLFIFLAEIEQIENLLKKRRN